MDVELSCCVVFLYMCALGCSLLYYKALEGLDDAKESLVVRNGGLRASQVMDHFRDCSPDEQSAALSLCHVV